MLLFLLLVLLGSVLNLLGLAGNWLILGMAVAHYFMVDRDLVIGFQFPVLMLLLFLALSGEALEFLSGLLGAGKAGGSRRAMLLSMLGGMIGSVFGFGIGNAVVFLLGGVVGIFLFGGLGALAGAMLGEWWKGSHSQKQMEVGKAAFMGKVLGTFAKTMAGSLMLVFCLVGLFV